MRQRHHPLRAYLCVMKGVLLGAVCGLLFINKKRATYVAYVDTGRARAERVWLRDWSFNTHRLNDGFA